MARGVALLAAIAVSLLAVSGAGGANAQTPKRGGTVVVRRRCAEPACLNVLLDDVRRGRSVLWILAVLRGAFASAPTSRSEPGLVSRVDFTRTPPFTLRTTSAPRLAGATGSRSPRRTSSSPYRRALRYLRAAGDPQRTDGDPQRPRRRREDGPRRPPGALRDWRGLFPAIVLPQHALRGEDLAQGLARPDRQPEDGQADRQRPVPRRSAGSAASSSRSSGTRRYWGPHRRTWTASSSASAGTCAESSPARCSRPAQRSDRLALSPASPEIVPELRRMPGVDGRFQPATTGSTSRFGSAPAGIPRSEQARAAGARVRRSTASHIVRRSSARSTRVADRARQRGLPDTRAATTGRTGRLSLPARRARACSSRPAAAGVPDGIYTCAGERLSLRFLTTAGAARERGARARPGAAPAGRYRGHARRTRPSRRSSARSSRVATSTSSLLRGSTRRSISGRGSTAAARSKTAPATASGSSRATSTRPSGSSTTRQRARS